MVSVVKIGEYLQQCKNYISGYKYMNWGAWYIPEFTEIKLIRETFVLPIMHLEKKYVKHEEVVGSSLPEMNA